MSSIQKIERHDGHGHVDWSHVSGLVWSCRLANHLPKHSRHHIGRQKHVRHWPTSGASQFFTNLTLALVCKQPIHVSNSSNKQNVNNRMDIYYTCWFNGNRYFGFRAICRRKSSKNKSLRDWRTTIFFTFSIFAWSLPRKSSYSLAFNLNLFINILNTKKIICFI